MDAAPGGPNEPDEVSFGQELPGSALRVLELLQVAILVVLTIRTGVVDPFFQAIFGGIIGLTLALQQARASSIRLTRDGVWITQGRWQFAIRLENISVAVQRYAGYQVLVVYWMNDSGELDASCICATRSRARWFPKTVGNDAKAFLVQLARAVRDRSVGPSHAVPRRSERIWRRRLITHLGCVALIYVATCLAAREIGVGRLVGALLAVAAFFQIWGVDKSGSVGGGRRREWEKFVERSAGDIR
jgi:hypothetical protein